MWHSPRLGNRGVEMGLTFAPLQQQKVADASFRMGCIIARSFDWEQFPVEGENDASDKTT